MKFLKVTMALAIVLALAEMVRADETTGATYTSPNGHAEGIADFLNDQNCIDHTHQYAVPDNDRENPLGVGADIEVVKVSNAGDNNVVKSVNLEAKYDTQNEETSVFAVVHCSLADIVSFLNFAD